jgi:hypothetical protein
MQLANVDVRGEGVLLEPTFKEFIDKLALAKPEWTFTFDYAKDGRYTTSRCMQQGRQVPEDAKYATRMSVTQNNIHLGVLGIQRNVSGDADKKWSLTVSSDNIQSRRGTLQRQSTWRQRYATPRPISSAPRWVRLCTREHRM